MCAVKLELMESLAVVFSLPVQERAVGNLMLPNSHFLTASILISSLCISHCRKSARLQSPQNLLTGTLEKPLHAVIKNFLSEVEEQDELPPSRKIWITSNLVVLGDKALCFMRMLEVAHTQDVLERDPQKLVRMSDTDWAKKSGFGAQAFENTGPILHHVTSGSDIWPG
ncbi:hypothetical protein FRC12_008028 [Ceratobasidium sp. 428]|nr:hypothetical protein FRC12_008028 [Ceratobasidium sp. 428]